MIAASSYLGWTAIAAEFPPNIPVSSNNNVWLQTGNANDAYWVEDNRWGAGSISEGVAGNQYEQTVGVSPSIGSAGEVAFRMKWRWPSPPGAREIKSFPSILSGRKPGYYSANNYVNGNPVRLLNGDISQIAPSGYTPGTIFPMQLPLRSLKAKAATRHLAPPSGQGQLTYDIWLQSSPVQDRGFGASSITHEIMIPLEHWGGYGAHNQSGGRNPGWYDHDATIGGKLYHVYATKGWDGALLYNFGGLNGNYGKTGWKMIAFVPAVLPVAAGEIDLAAIINYVATRKDVKGNPWALGNEYVASVELGVETVVGTGDLVVYDYKVSANGTAPTPLPAPSPVPAPAATCGNSPGWNAQTRYTSGNVVSYSGRQYLARGVNFINIVPTNTDYWSSSPCTSSPAPAPAPAPAPPPSASCGNFSAWDSQIRYTSGNIVSYSGQQYLARGVNFIDIVPTNANYWSRYVCASPPSAPAPTCSNITGYSDQTRYTTGRVVSYGGRSYVAKGVNFISIVPTNSDYWSLTAC